MHAYINIDICIYKLLCINISIHIRINWANNLKYNTDYLFFYDALQFIKDKIDEKDNNKIIINVFSDDIAFVKNNFNFTNNIVVYYEDNPDYIDLWCISLCKHNILSNSTLSWWGAYINRYKNKYVIYPKDLLRLFHATVYDEYKNIERIYEHYKPEWIGLDNKNVIYQINNK